MSVENFRANYEAEVAAALAETPDDPLIAGTEASAQQAFARSVEPPVAVIGDTGVDRADRVAAIDAARLDAISRPDVMETFIAVLQNGSDDPQVRRAALGALEELSFAVTAFAGYGADYRTALRAAATADDQALREAALEVLAIAHDEYAQQLLVQGLRDPSAALIDRMRALQYLGYDLHSGEYDLLREIASGSANSAERSAAVRLLGGDAESAELLRRLVRDRAEDVGVRAQSALALNAMAPEEFAPIAREIALDADEDDELRATSLMALTVAPAESPPELADEAMAVSRAPSAELERAADQYREVKGSGA